MVNISYFRTILKGQCAGLHSRFNIGLKKKSYFLDLQLDGIVQCTLHPWGHMIQNKTAKTNLGVTVSYSGHAEVNGKRSTMLIPEHPALRMIKHSFNHSFCGTLVPLWSYEIPYWSHDTTLHIVIVLGHSHQLKRLAKP